MQKSLNFLTIIALFVATMFIFSCKEIPGPQGTAGTPGLNGRDGVAGAPGKEGNANVKGNVFNVKSSDWQKVFYTGSTTYYYYAVVFNIPEITQNVVDKGMVVCYRSGATTTSWAAMPYSFSFDSGSTVKVYNYDAVHALGKMFISLGSTDDLPFAPSSEQNYKVVVITPSGLSAHPNVNYKSYAEVADTFGLE
jgi:hypothetical protein